MVYLHFPSNFTDEELMLQNKYAKLRKKKKALQDMKAPKPEPEKVNPLKRQLDPKDAKEQAKKLIMAGKVHLPAKTPVEKTSFKRSRILERKINSTPRIEPGMSSFDKIPLSSFGSSTPSSSINNESNIQFEPFTPSFNEDNKDSTFGNFSTPQKQQNTNSPRTPYRNNLKEWSPNTNDYNKKNQISPNSPKSKRGQTIYIHGHGVTEEFLRENFNRFGKILNLKIGSNNSGFITFDKIETAEKAITEMNGAHVEEINLTVEFARKQPSIHSLINDAPASATWTALASSQSQKGTHNDKRQQIIYDDIS